MKNLRKDILGKSISEQFNYMLERDRRAKRIGNAMPLALLIILTTAFCLSERSFLSAANIQNLLFQVAIPLILGTGITFVLLLGSIDLSLEGVMGFAGSAISMLILNSKNSNDFGFFGVLLPIFAGATFGALTGFLHTKFHIASFIITYAMGSIASGLAVMSYRSSTPTIRVAWADGLSTGTFIGIPYITWIALAYFGLACIVLYFTSFGRSVYAIGDNETATRASGTNVDRTKIAVYAISGLSASLGGFIALVRLKIGQVALGNNQLFPTIAALVIAGTSLSGGKGGMLRTLIGIIIYTEIQNFLTIVGVDAYYKNALQGVLILVAVAATVDRSKRMSK